MNRLRLIVLSLCFLGMSDGVYPAQINVYQALEKAQQFYNQKITSNLRSAPAFELAYSCKDTSSMLRSSNPTTYYYIFNVGSAQGFVIASGDDATKTILGYSDEGVFSVENMPANLQGWLDFYQSEIKYAIENELNTSLVDTTSGMQLKSATSVAPLLGNIKWNQGNPYNILCPRISGKLTVTGCVATAMAQIMKYYQWPAAGVGSHTYTSENCGTLTANFSQAPYDWANMTDTYGASSTAGQNTAVATLMYHCGVAVDMNYNTGIQNSGSSASVNDAGRAMFTYFGYDPDIQLYTRTLYAASDWESMIVAELNASRPVLYSGNDGETGHAFVCDGYDTNHLFHMNWGWSGLGNGYFELSALAPPVADTKGFNQDQSILAGIKKPDGVANSSYEFGIWNTSLTSSTTTISNIRTGTFNLNYGILNNGINTFTGEIGLGLYKDGVFQSKLKSATVTLDSNYGYNSYPFKTVSLSGLTSGNYQIYCIYKASNASTWSIVKSTASTNNYINVNISGTSTLSAAIQTPSTALSLVLTKAIQHTGDMYQNHTANFSVTIQNTGREFYSNLGLKLNSATDPLLSQFINSGVVCIPAGETKTFNFSGNITCTPGSYYAIAVYDSTNTFSTLKYKELGPALFSQVPVTILSEQGTGLEEASTDEMTVYPNPVKNQLYIHTTEPLLYIQISDLTGKKIQSDYKTKTLEVGNLKKGVYLLRIETKIGTKTFKFIKD